MQIVSAVSVIRGTKWRDVLFIGLPFMSDWHQIKGIYGALLILDLIEVNINSFIIEKA